MTLSPIHPFPARMAPDLACRALDAVPAGGVVLDPMCGSGTVARAAVEAGFDCVGSDVDPLSVLMASVWTTRLDTEGLLDRAEDVVGNARIIPFGQVERTDDPETQRFVTYWFAPQQEEALARLATVLRREVEPAKGALAVALSRIIVSKEPMASLARDTSHSRPHKVAEASDFDVYGGFLRSVRHVASKLQPDAIRSRADIRQADARRLEGVENDSFDLALTSPPYLNAIDYLRGHRLALVWLGYEMGRLREVRAASVGAERALPKGEALPMDISPFVLEQGGAAIEAKHWGWLRRYASDMHAVLHRLGEVVKANGRVVMILGNSILRGVEIDNAGLIEALATNIGFRPKGRDVREIPARRRYLPPPGSGQGPLDTRMRTETVLTLGAP